MLATETTLPTWVTITTGEITDADDALKRLEQAGVAVTDQAQACIENMRFSNKKARFDLVKVPFQYVGLTDFVKTRDLWEKIVPHGLVRAGPLAALAMWLQYPDLLPTNDNGVIVASRPLRGDFVPDPYSPTSRYQEEYHLGLGNYQDDGPTLCATEAVCPITGGPRLWRRSVPWVFARNLRLL